MKKTLKVTFLLLSTLITMPGFTAASGQYGPYNYILPVNDPQVIPNISVWTVHAECTIISDTDNNIISVKALYKKGSVNSVQLKRGDTLVVTADAGEVLYLEAESGARVELTNEGNENITARCYASFESKSPHNLFISEYTPDKNDF